MVLFRSHSTTAAVIGAAPIRQSVRFWASLAHEAYPKYANIYCAQICTCLYDPSILQFWIRLPADCLNQSIQKLIPRLNFGITAVSLGDVSLDVTEPANPELVPSLKPSLPYGIQLDVPEVLRHLRWMFQKAKLLQDMFLLGYACGATWLGN